MRSIRQKISSLRKTVLDILFPIYCFSCRKEGFWLCMDCSEKIALLDFQICPLCENILTPAGFLCHSCRALNKSGLDAMTVCVSYESRIMKNMLHKFKYNFVSDLAEPLAEIMIRALLRNSLPLPDLIVPVPLHPRRLRWRGFNQSSLLAERISRDLVPLMEIKKADLLKRSRYNCPQMKIKKYKDRIDNVKDIFYQEIDSKDINQKIILLVDDIATTGATLQECAKILKKNGAKKVFAVVIARQTLKK